MSKKVNKIIFITCAFLLAFFVIANVSSLITYSVMFQRVDDIDYSITPGIINYQEIKETLPRTEYKYESNEEILCGYYYKNDDVSPLIVVSSGYNDVSDSLLSYHKYFYDLGYNVFSYDNSGSGKSSGTQEGFYQSLIDLESTLKFINKTPELTNLPLLLFGFSTGGFATTSIFNIDDFDVLASVSISGYNDANTLMFNKGKQYIGFISYLGLPTINIITNRKYKNYLSYNSLSGINNTNIPIYIAHGKKDETIDYDFDSIIAQRDNITNTNVTFDTYIDKGHVSILYDDVAITYQNEVNGNIKSIKDYSQKQSYVETIDDALYSKINLTLANNIHLFYQRYI